MEVLAGDIQALDKDFLQELIRAFAIVASEYNSKVAKLVRNIPLDFYLGDQLVADDPVKSAELGARRDEASDE